MTSSVCVATSSNCDSAFGQLDNHCSSRKRRASHQLSVFLVMLPITQSMTHSGLLIHRLPLLYSRTTGHSVYITYELTSRVLHPARSRYVLLKTGQLPEENSARNLYHNPFRPKCAACGHWLRTNYNYILRYETVLRVNLCKILLLKLYNPDCICTYYSCFPQLHSVCMKFCYIYEIFYISMSPTLSNYPSYSLSCYSTGYDLFGFPALTVWQ